MLWGMCWQNLYTFMWRHYSTKSLICPQWPCVINLALILLASKSQNDSLCFRCPTNTACTCSPGIKPTLPELLKFTCTGGRVVNIPVEIATKYVQFGMFLLDDRTGSRFQIIAHKLWCWTNQHWNLSGVANWKRQAASDLAILCWGLTWCWTTPCLLVILWQSNVNSQQS